MLDEVFGLPAHPLIIHLPLVLGPLVGLLTVLLLVPSWREKLLKPTAALAVLFAASAAVAVKSGENFAATLQVGEFIGDHADAAKTLRLLAFGLAAALIVAVFAVPKLGRALQTAAVALIAVLGIATVGFTVKTGHEGAKAVWEAPFDAAKEAQTGAGDASEDAADDAADRAEDAADEAADQAEDNSGPGSN